ncbi:MAG: sigma-54-dependent transcriptional regulator [Planctomycetota bacterium]|jgi:DNA-binding NtrC family response regulator
MSEYKILVIDDAEATRETLLEILSDEGHNVVTAKSCTEAKIELTENQFDLILSDLMLKDGTGMELLENAKAIQLGVPFVIITGHGSIENAIEATRLGAYEYITKPLDLKKLRVLVRNALHLRSLERKVGQQDALDAIIGQSDSVLKLKEMISQVAKTDATVLINGETGTGKELVANAFHFLSERKDKKYIKVNIAALPKDLLESELFGHEKGAFTGALKNRAGRFELADKGTVFLDEIAEMPMETQVKLLRVLQEHEFEKVGGTDVVHSDFRLIAATNKDIKKMIGNNEFREDLYFRINVVNVWIPSLRERKDDIPLLCDHFLKMYNSRYNKNVELSREALNTIINYTWPGNIRELENAMERAVVTSLNNTIKKSDLPEEVCGKAEPLGGGISMPAALSMDEIEKRYTLSEYQRIGKNKTKLAKSLGIGLKTLYRKFESWDVKD